MRVARFLGWWLALVAGCMAASAAELALPAVLKDAAPNTFVKLCEGLSGSRLSPGLVFSPEHGRFLLFGGAMDIEPGKNPYTEMSLDLEKCTWENLFPEGKLGVWGELTGPSSAPGFGRDRFQDTEGNVRPNLSGPYYRGMHLYNNYAYDRDHGRIVALFHLDLTHPHRLTIEYDVKSRTWAEMEGTLDLPQQFWDGAFIGQMCYDPVNKEVIGSQFEWAYKDDRWRKLEYGSKLINGLRGKVREVWFPARNLVGACRARFYIAESPEEEKADRAREGMWLV